ncbi:MAG: hypothetical protein GX224_02415 [Thermoplasmatales archaeon]|nr:hypothetical protein [Thermoplasmatales archaeon]
MKGIPAVSARAGGDGVVVGPLSFEGGSPIVPEGTLGFGEYQSGFRRGQPILVVDAAGFAGGALEADVLKGLTARGKELWVSTPVRDVGDLFDAFSTGMDYLVVPTHFVRGVDDLAEMHEVSDRVVPAVFAAGGRAPGGGSVESALLSARSVGFELAAVFDTDGSIPEWEWKRLLSSGIGIVPYAPEKWDWETETCFLDAFRTFS